MAEQLPRLVTSRYVPPDAYIGTIFRPGQGAPTNDVRLPCYIAKGSRLFQFSNISIRRSFIFDETLNFTTSEPYIAELDYQSDGDVTSPVRLYSSDGVEINAGKWQFVTGADAVTANKAVQISPEAFDATTTYFIDYQSTSREVVDFVPFQDLREIIAMGLAQDADQFTEYDNFYIPTGFGSLYTIWDGSPTIANTEPIFTTDGSSSAGGDGSPIVTADCAYIGKYSRGYEFEVIDGSDKTAVVIAWRAIADQYGNDVQPTTPGDAADASTWPTITIDVDTGPDTSEVEGILTVAFEQETGNYTTGDTFDLTVTAPPVIEGDERHGNPSKFSNASSIYENTLSNLGKGLAGTAVDDTVMELTDISSYTAITSPRNRKYLLRVTSLDATNITFHWTRFGIEGETEGDETLTIASLPEDITMDGLVLSVKDVNAMSVGDVFNFTMRAPKVFIHAKDPRSFRFSVSAATSTVVSMAYNTNTQEGGFGTVSATNVGTGNEDGQFILPGNIYMHARNIDMFTAADILRIGDFDDNPGLVVSPSEDSAVIDWSLTDKQVDESATVLTDRNGSITGEAGTKYVILDNVPVSEDSITVAGISSFTWIEDTAFLAFTDSLTDETVTVSYEYAGDEPLPGQLYYITANALRPDTHYNSVIKFYSKDEGVAFLAPSTINNDANIMNEIAWAESPFGVAFVLAKDEDDDGVYTKTDYENAIDATIADKDITDKILIGGSIAQSALGRLIQLNVQDNDPFNKRRSSMYVGMESGTEIGDANTPGTIIYMAKSTLAVYGDNPAHGKRILQSHTSATKSIVLDGGTTAVVNLNGSFISGALAAKNASFQDPSTTMLKRQLTSFDTIDMYTEPENLRLGGASIIYFSLAGDGVYRIEEDVTVDTFNQHFNLISSVNQTDLVARIVEREMSNSLISMVPPTVATGVALVKGTLVTILSGLISRGLMASPQDDDGNPRPLSPEDDVFVEVDETDKTLYHFYYAQWTRKPIKRLYGLVSVDTNNFTLA